MPEKWIPPPPGSRWRDEGVADGGYLFPFHPIPLPLPPPDVARFKLPQHGKLLCPFGGERGWKRKIAKGEKRRKGGEKTDAAASPFSRGQKLPPFPPTARRQGGRRSKEQKSEEGRTEKPNGKKEEKLRCVPPPPRSL